MQELFAKRHNIMIFDEKNVGTAYMPSVIDGKNTRFGRDISRPYFISHQAYYMTL